MIDISDIDFNDSSKNITNILFSQIITLYLLKFLLINPYIIKRYALGEKFSEFMKEYYLNNSLEGTVFDIISNSILFLVSFKLYNLKISKNSSHKILNLSIIILSVIFLKNLIFRIYCNIYKGSSENISFFKEWLNICFEQTFLWNIIYYSCITLIFLFISLKKYDMFFPMLSCLNIYLINLLHK